MGRTKKKGAPPAGEFTLFDETEPAEGDVDEDLPKDEAGRAKIKQQYVELLGIRVQKLAGRILNRERINKTVEGVYFICAQCKRVCHNLDEGLVEDADNARNLCTVCSKGGDVTRTPRKAPGKKAPAALALAVSAAAARSRAATAAKPAKAVAPAKSTKSAKKPSKK